MKRIIDKDVGVPIKLWLDNIEEGALKQAYNLANLPFVVSHIALMPDSHEGYGMPIGGVMATKDVVIPNAVGVDIGCGICAVPTSIYSLGKQELNDIMKIIRKYVPVGFKHQSQLESISRMPHHDLFRLI